MIKFKEHDGLLFKMLDEPVPLKENDENVLVRFITHGVIGEYVMEHWLDCNQENKPIYIDDVDSDGDVTVWIENENGNEEHHCCPFPMFEVIGTLVKEGSKEWALYQMMKGEKVCNPTLATEKATRLGYDDVEWFNTFWYIVGDAVVEGKSNYGTLSVSSWIDAASSTGWQIYKEPKPESEYKVGDYLEVDENGKIVHCYIVPKSEANQEISGLLYDLSTPKRWVGCIYRNKPNTHIIRKLKPSEVQIKIGCLSGTIRYCLSFDHDGEKHDAIKIFNGDGKCIAIIHLEALDTGTRELVESLLKAQEEEDEKR